MLFDEKKRYIQLIFIGSIMHKRIVLCSVIFFSCVLINAAQEPEQVEQQSPFAELDEKLRAKREHAEEGPFAEKMIADLQKERESEEKELDELLTKKKKEHEAYANDLKRKVSDWRPWFGNASSYTMVGIEDKKIDDDKQQRDHIITCMCNTYKAYKAEVKNIVISVARDFESQKYIFDNMHKALSECNDEQCFRDYGVLQKDAASDVYRHRLIEMILKRALKKCHEKDIPLTLAEFKSICDNNTMYKKVFEELRKSNTAIEQLLAQNDRQD